MIGEVGEVRGEEVELGVWGFGGGLVGSAEGVGLAGQPDWAGKTASIIESFKS